MVPRTLPGLVFLVLPLTSLNLQADEYAPVPTQPPLRTAPRLLPAPGPGYSLGSPSLQRPAFEPQHGHLGRHKAPAPPAPSSGGWTGYGFGGVPTYQWGYFGARYRPVKVYHRGYYGHRTSFGYRRGY